MKYEGKKIEEQYLSRTCQPLEATHYICQLIIEKKMQRMRLMMLKRKKIVYKNKLKNMIFHQPQRLRA
jgi:hypothetical protein